MALPTYKKGGNTRRSKFLIDQQFWGDTSKAQPTPKFLVDQVAPIRQYRTQGDIPQFRPDVRLTPEQVVTNKKINEKTKSGTDAYNKKLLADRQARIDASNAADQNVFSSDAYSRESLNQASEGTPDKMRLFPNSAGGPGQVFDEYINPLYWVGSMAQNFGKAPLKAEQTDSNLPYLKAVTEPLVAGALGFSPIDKVKSVYKGLNRWIDNRIPSSFSSELLTAPYSTEKGLQNMKDLEFAIQQFGNTYKIPKDLGRIAQSDRLTDMTIRGLVNRDNTFVRGVSTNWKEIIKKNPETVKHLDSVGIDWKNNPKAAAEYMATHIPINTGYGRASLDKDIFDKGLNGLYTSNSIGTAEGYTYGDGFIAKVKRPTDFSSSSRSEWINNNRPDYYSKELPQVYKNSWDKAALEHQPTRQAALDFLKSRLELNPNNQNTEAIKEAIANIESPGRVLDKNIIKTEYTEPLAYERAGIENGDPYAHYIHLGQPGEKVLDVISSKRVTPETWGSQSRAHSGAYSRGLSAASLALPIAGGAFLSQYPITTEQQKYGGRFMKKYNWGGSFNNSYGLQPNRQFGQTQSYLPNINLGMLNNNQIGIDKQPTFVPQNYTMPGSGLYQQPQQPGSDTTRGFGVLNRNNIIGTSLVTGFAQAIANGIDNSRQQDYIAEQNDPYSINTPISGQSYGVKYGYQKLGGYFKDGGHNVVVDGKPMYKRKDEKVVKRGIWSNTYLSKKEDGGYSEDDLQDFLWGDEKEQEPIVSDQDVQQDLDLQRKQLQRQQRSLLNQQALMTIEGPYTNNTSSRPDTNRPYLQTDTSNTTSYKDNIAAGESGGNYLAKNPTSTAFGKYQFIKGTRTSVYNQSTLLRNLYHSQQEFEQDFTGLNGLEPAKKAQEVTMDEYTKMGEPVHHNDPIAKSLYHYAPRFAQLYVNGQLDLDKTAYDYGVGTKSNKNPTFRSFLRTHGFKGQFSKGGTI